MVKSALGALMNRGRMCLHLPLCFLIFSYPIVMGMKLISKVCLHTKECKIRHTLWVKSENNGNKVLVGVDSFNRKCLIQICLYLFLSGLSCFY